MKKNTGIRRLLISLLFTAPLLNASLVFDSSFMVNGGEDIAYNESTGQLIVPSATGGIARYSTFGSFFGSTTVPDVSTSFIGLDALPNGNVLISYGDRIEEFIVTTGGIAEGIGFTVSGSPDFRSVDYDPTDDVIWAADRDTKTVYKLSTSGSTISTFTANYTGDLEGMALAPNRTSMLFADDDNQRLVETDLSGNVINYHVLSGYSNIDPEGISVDGNTIYVSNDTGSRQVAIFTATGTLAIPEPSTYAMMGLGALAIGIYFYRRHKQG